MLDEIERPEKICVNGVILNIKYCKKAYQIDKEEREILRSQLDMEKYEIRIFDNNEKLENIWTSILFEIINCIGKILHLDYLKL